MGPFRKLVGEIHRRSLWQILAIYGVGSWIAIQVVQTLTEALGLPEWFPPFAVVLLIVGLPVVLATAFVQEGVGPGAGERQVDAPDDAFRAGTGAGHRLFTWRNAAFAGTGAFALWGVAAAGWILWGGPGGVVGSDREASVAVLPFASMSVAEGSGEVFAAGIHEEIIAELARLRDLKVISRTSVMEYAQQTRNLRRIAEELGVRMILEGSVRTDQERVRVTAQLIDAESDEHLWAETYDRTLTAGSLFDIQSEIAQAIAERLQVQVSPEEREGIGSRPTESLEAYQAYLEGKQAQRASQAEEDTRRALALYERAAELDPRFAAAHAKIGETGARIWWYHFDRGPDVRPRAKAAIDRALALDPTSPEAWTSLGYYHYWGFLDYERALEAFGRAAELQPGNPDIFAGLAYVHRRQGRMEETLEELLHAVELDPRSADLSDNLGNTYRLLRRYPEAERAHERAIELNPTWAGPYQSTAEVALAASGDIRAARRMGARARAAGATMGPEPIYFWGVVIELLDGRPELALEVLDTLSLTALDTQFEYIPTALFRAEAHAMAGRHSEARRHYEDAGRTLEERLHESPDDSRLHSTLGLAYAALGLRREALFEARLGTAILPVEREAWRGAHRLQDLAQVHAMIGNRDEAVEILEQLLSIPGDLSPALLRLDPAWRPLHGHPGFEALVGGTGGEAPAAARDAAGAEARSEP